MLQYLLRHPHVVDVDAEVPRVFLGVGDFPISFIDKGYDWECLYVNYMAMTEARTPLYADDVFFVVVFLPLEIRKEIFQCPGVRKAGGTGLYKTLRNVFGGEW